MIYINHLRYDKYDNNMLNIHNLKKEENESIYNEESGIAFGWEEQ